MAQPNHQLCTIAMKHIRQVLQAPPPEAAAWRSITKQHRVRLLMGAGISAERHADGWERFSAADQAKITDQVKAGADLARRWSGLHWQSARRTRKQF